MIDGSPAPALALLHDLTNRLKKANENGASWELHEIVRALTGKKFFDVLIGEASLSKEELDRIRAAVERRLAGEPLGYILGETVFMGARLWVDEAALIPRVETELVVEAAVEYAARFPGRELKAADLGSGTGCISIALLQRAPNVRIDCYEVSPKAAALTRRNLERHGLLDRAEVINEDYLDGRKMAVSRYDLIVGNPPYVAECDFDGLDEEVRREPKLALVGGRQGTEILHRIIAELPARIETGGALILECGYAQAPSLVSIAHATVPLKLFKLIKDHQAIDRVMAFHKE